jgi:heat shock protein HslJ
MTAFIRIVTVSALASLLLAACGGTTVDSADSLEGQWEIEQIADESGTLTSPIDGTSPFLSFADVTTDESSVSGDTGCNSFSGPVEVGGDGSFEAGDFMMTLMGCPDDLGTQEGLILSHMSAADTWAVDGDTASLSTDGAVVLALRRIDTSLAGSRWLVTGINNQSGGVQSVLAGTEPTLGFQTDGLLFGTTGCNDLTGVYNFKESSIKIVEIDVNRGFCETPDGVMDQEQNMVAALENAATYAITGSTLNLRDAGGSTMLNAQRLPEPTP